MHKGPSHNRGGPPSGSDSDFADDNPALVSEPDMDDGFFANMLRDESNFDDNNSHSEEEIDIPILSTKDSHTWAPPKKAFSWFQRVADKELSEGDMDNFMKDFIPPSDIWDHFEPPKLPLPIWNRLKSFNNTDELFRQKAILKR